VIYGTIGLINDGKAIDFRGIIVNLVYIGFINSFSGILWCYATAVAENHWKITLTFYINIILSYV